MPIDKTVLGFANQWYPLAFETARPFVLPNRSTIQLITAPLFVATKLEAFASRGNGDYYASHDLEDVIALADGRPELSEEASSSPLSVRQFIRDSLQMLLDDSAFVDAIPAHVSYDALAADRTRIVEQRLRSLGR